jgi:DNA primase
MRFKEKGYHCIHLVGSALTEKQEDLLSRHFPKLILMFDGDEAGLKATEDGLRDPEKCTPAPELDNGTPGC